MQTVSGQDKQSKTAIVVPCFNEDRRLAEDPFLSAVAGDEKVDFIFVDDGSTDQTGARLRSLCNRSAGRMQCLALDANRGKAEAVRRGFLEALSAGYGFVGYWDADLSTPLDAIPHFKEHFSDPRVFMVMGSRVKLLGRMIKRRARRHYPGRVLATLTSIILGLGVYDTQCGAKLFRVTEALGKVFDRPFMTTWVFDVEIIARFIVLERQGILPAGTVSSGIIEYPVEEWSDIPGSKIRFADYVLAPVELCRVHRYLRTNTKRS